MRNFLSANSPAAARSPGVSLGISRLELIDPDGLIWGACLANLTCLSTWLPTRFYALRRGCRLPCVREAFLYMSSTLNDSRTIQGGLLVCWRWSSVVVVVLTGFVLSVLKVVPLQVQNTQYNFPYDQKNTATTMHPKHKYMPAQYTYKEQNTLHYIFLNSTVHIHSPHSFGTSESERMYCLRIDPYRRHWQSPFDSNRRLCIYMTWC